MDAVKHLDRIEAHVDGAVGMDYVDGLKRRCYEAMDDDLNTPMVISALFEACHLVNQLADGQKTIAPEALEALKETFQVFCHDILGLSMEQDGNGERELSYSKAIDLLLEIRQQAKANKDWATSDRIRNELAALGFEVKDTRDGATWKLNK